VRPFLLFSKNHCKKTTFSMVAVRMGGKTPAIGTEIMATLFHNLLQLLKNETTA
jgi:hypothetical protein